VRHKITDCTLLGSIEAGLLSADLDAEIGPKQGRNHRGQLPSQKFILPLKKTA